MENQNQNGNSEQQTINIQVPSADNIANRRSLIPVSFAFAILFFFFTFCDFKCGSEKIGSVTGFDLVTGTELKDHDMFTGRETRGKEIPSSIWAILAFGSAIIGLGAFIIKEKRESLIGAGAGFGGVGSLVILQFVIKSAIEEEGKGKLEADLQFPYWGALLALGVAGFISYLRMKKTHNLPVSLSASSETQNTGNTSLIPSHDFDFTQWLKENYKITIGVVILVGLAYYAYNTVIKRDPSEDGQSISSKICDCGKKQNEYMINCYKNFIVDFDGYKFSGRSEAKQKLESLIKPATVDFQKCYDERQAELSKIKEKYITNKEQIEKFEYAFSAQQGLCNNSSNELGSISSEAYSKIEQFIGDEERKQQAIQDSINAERQEAERQARIMAEAAEAQRVEKEAEERDRQEAVAKARINQLTGRWVRQNGGSKREGMVIEFNGSIGTIITLPDKAKDYSVGHIKWKDFDPYRLTIGELSSSGWGGSRYITCNIYFQNSKMINITSPTGDQLIYKKE